MPLELIWKIGEKNVCVGGKEVNFKVAILKHTHTHTVSVIIPLVELASNQKIKESECG